MIPTSKAGPDRRAICMKAAAASSAKARAQTHCRNGHPYAAEGSFRMMRDYRGYMFRRCCACAKMKWNRQTGRKKLSKTKLEQVFAALREGQTLQSIYGRKGDKFVGGGITKPDILGRFRRQHPKVDRLITQLAAANREAAKPVRLVAPAVVQRSGAEVFAVIAAATANLPDFLREDVRSSMIVAAWEGRLHPRDAAKRVREFVTAHNRQFSKFVPGGGIMQSLDQQVYDDGPTRLVDTVTRGLWG